MADMRVVVDCSAPNKAASERVTAAQIEAILRAERNGTLEHDEATRRLNDLRDFSAAVAAAPDPVYVVELTAEESAQLNADRDEARNTRVAELRAERDIRLSACDWTQLPDAKLPGSSTPAQWETYRQKLRDWPATIEDPYNPPAWPRPPA